MRKKHLRLAAPIACSDILLEIRDELSKLRTTISQGAVAEQVDSLVLKIAERIGTGARPFKEELGIPQGQEVIDAATLVLLADSDGYSSYRDAEIAQRIDDETEPYDEQVAVLEVAIDELLELKASETRVFMDALPEVLEGIFSRGITDACVRKGPEEEWKKDYEAIVGKAKGRIIDSDPCGIGRKRLKELIEKHENIFKERRKGELSTLQGVREECEDCEYNTSDTVAAILEYSKKAYSFFKTPDGRSYIAFDIDGTGETVCVEMDLSAGSPYWRQLGLAGFLPQVLKHKAVAQALRDEALRSGNLVKPLTWIDATSEGAVFLLPHDGGDDIWRINCDGIRRVPNGLNEDHVFLNSSPLVQEPIEIDSSLATERVVEGIVKYRDVVRCSLACSPANQNLISAWFVSCLVREFFQTRAQVAGRGSFSTGKTAAASYFHLLLYGTGNIADLTSAASSLLRSREPIIFGDDEEENDLSEKEKRANRRAATGGARVMREVGTTDGLVIQPARNMRWTNGITEGMDATADRSRTLVVPFDAERWGNDNHDDAKIRQEILKNRSLIWSALAHIMSKDLLPLLNEEAERDRVRSLLKTRLKQHPKNRLLDHLVVMHAVLSVLNRWATFCTSVDDEAMGWITEQGDIERVTGEDADEVVRHLTLVARRVVGQGASSLGTWPAKKWIEKKVKGIEEPRVIGWKATAGDLWEMFYLARKDGGLYGNPPFKNAGSVGCKLGNSLRGGTLAAAGWQVKPPPKDVTSAKRVWTIIAPVDLVPFAFAAEPANEGKSSKQQ